MSYHHFQIFEKIGTDESQIDACIALSEIINLFIKLNTCFLSNSQNDIINRKLHEHLTCAVIFWYDQPTKAVIICNS